MEGVMRPTSGKLCSHKRKLDQGSSRPFQQTPLKRAPGLQTATRATVEQVAFPLCAGVRRLRTVSVAALASAEEFGTSCCVQPRGYCAPAHSYKKAAIHTLAGAVDAAGASPPAVRELHRAWAALVGAPEGSRGSAPDDDRFARGTTERWDLRPLRPRRRYRGAAKCSLVQWPEGAMRQYLVYGGVLFIESVGLHHRTIAVCIDCA
eukprot:scaffold1605_cov340-Prasinococcus_capsulatus_cf.AAC.6